MRKTDGSTPEGTGEAPGDQVRDGRQISYGPTHGGKVVPILRGDEKTGRRAVVCALRREETVRRAAASEVSPERTSTPPAKRAKRDGGVAGGRNRPSSTPRHGAVFSVMKNTRRVEIDVSISHAVREDEDGALLSGPRPRSRDVLRHVEQSERGGGGGEDEGRENRSQRQQRQGGGQENERRHAEEHEIERTASIYTAYFLKQSRYETHIHLSGGSVAMSTLNDEGEFENVGAAESKEELDAFGAKQTKDYPRELRRNRDIKKVNAILRKLAQNEKTNNLNCDIYGTEMKCKLDEDPQEDKARINSLDRDLKKCKDDVSTLRQKIDEFNEEGEEFQKLLWAEAKPPKTPEDVQAVIWNAQKKGFGFNQAMLEAIRFVFDGGGNNDVAQRECIQRLTQLQGQYDEVVYAYQEERKNQKNQEYRIERLKNEINTLKNQVSEDLKDKAASQKELSEKKRLLNQCEIKLKRKNEELQAVKKGAGPAAGNWNPFGIWKWDGGGAAAAGLNYLFNQPANGQWAGNNDGGDFDSPPASPNDAGVGGQDQGPDGGGAAAAGGYPDPSDGPLPNDGQQAGGAAADLNTPDVKSQIESIVADARSKKKNDGERLLRDEAWKDLFEGRETVTITINGYDLKIDPENNYSSNTYTYFLVDLQKRGLAGHSFDINANGRVTTVRHLTRPQAAVPAAQAAPPDFVEEMKNMTAIIKNNLPKNSNGSRCRGKAAILISDENFTIGKGSHQSTDFNEAYNNNRRLGKANDATRKAGKEKLITDGSLFHWFYGVYDYLQTVKKERFPNTTSIVAVFEIRGDVEVSGLTFENQNMDEKNFDSVYIATGGRSYMFAYKPDQSDEMRQLISKINELRSNEAITEDQFRMLNDSLDANSQRKQLINRGIVSADGRYHVGGFAESVVEDDEDASRKELYSAIRGMYEVMETTKDKIRTEKKSIDDVFQTLESELQESLKAHFSEEVRNSLLTKIYYPIRDKVLGNNELVDVGKEIDKTINDAVNYMQSFESLQRRQLLNAITNVLLTENDELRGKWASLWEMAHLFHVLRSQIYRQMYDENYTYKAMDPLPLLAISGGEAAEDSDSDDSEDEDFDAFEAFLNAGSASSGTSERRGRGSGDNSGSVDRLAAMFL